MTFLMHSRIRARKRQVFTQPHNLLYRFQNAFCTNDGPCVAQRVTKPVSRPFLHVKSPIFTREVPKPNTTKALR